MVELQILNKVLSDQSDSIITLNGITDDYFNQYKEEWEFIKKHKEEYGNIPNIETFLAKYPDFDVLQVSESTDYLINTFREEYLYSLSVPIITKLSELLQTNSYEAVDYLKSKIPELKVAQAVKGVDIISQADERLREYKETKESKDTHFIPTGFEELDEVIGGYHMGEELVVIFARTGQGKTWVSLKMLEHMWKMNKRIGLLEPEMSSIKTGYRFDTLHKHISNSSLTRGNEIQGYERYIDNLSNSDVPFFVSHPKDFQRKVTVSKLKSWVENNNIDVLAIDGISYLTDERKERGDSRTTQLTNISEDLMDLSIELKIPVIVVCQSNREGVHNEDLELENIRDSDGIAYNASLVLAVQQKDPGLQISIKKSRNSSKSAKLTYLWDIDVGKFEYVPSGNSGIDDEEKAENIRRRYKDEDEEY